MKVFNLCLKTLFNGNRQSIILHHNLRPIEPAGKLINYCTETNKKETVAKKKKFVKSDGAVVTKTFPATEKITLININGSNSVVYLEEAKKMAKSQNYNLIKLKQKEGNKDVYKLTKGTALLQQTSLQNTKMKKIILRSEILDYDFQLKLSQIHKLLLKGKSVVVLLEGKEPKCSKLENLSTLIQNRFNLEYNLTKTQKASGIRFIITPQDKKEKSDNEEFAEQPS